MDDMIGSSYFAVFKTAVPMCSSFSCENSIMGNLDKNPVFRTMEYSKHVLVRQDLLVTGSRPIFISPSRSLDNV